jgi:beta-phosphoglucomutase
LKLTDQEFRKTWGSDSRKFLPELYPEVRKEILEEIRHLKAKKYPDFVGETSLNEALMGLLYAARKQVEIGLVTTAKQANVDLLLSHHKLTNFFDAVVSGDDVKHGKPSPEGYLLAMQMLSSESSLCLAIEDSDIGVQAAQSAGISCLRVESYESK